MAEVLVPVAFALLCWWFGTGAVLWLVRRPVLQFPLIRLLGTLVLVLSLFTTYTSMSEPGEVQAYLGFASVILMWAWHELAFLTGWITGTRRVALTPGAKGWRRFSESTRVVIWHELALLGNFLLLLAMQQGQPSHVALCTFAILWCMRLSAKLNLFVGVPEVGDQYLPGHLRYLASYFRQRRLGAFFWLSVGGATLIWLWILHEGVMAAESLSVGWVLLASLLGLAILEHILMAFPAPVQKLWSWAMARDGASDRAGRIDEPVPAPPGVVVVKPGKATSI